MRAREQLRNVLLHHGWHAPQIDGMLDEYAHELAERQRSYAREVGVPLEDGGIVCAGDVIDWTDPHVGSEGQTA